MDNDSGQDIPDDHPAIQVINEILPSLTAVAAIAWQFDIPRETPQNHALW